MSEPKVKGQEVRQVFVGGGRRTANSHDKPRMRDKTQGKTAICHTNTQEQKWGTGQQSGPHCHPPWHREHSNPATRSHEFNNYLFRWPPNKTWSCAKSRTQFDNFPAPLNSGPRTRTALKCGHICGKQADVSFSLYRMLENTHNVSTSLIQLLFQNKFKMQMNNQIDCDLNQKV